MGLRRSAAQYHQSLARGLNFPLFGKIFGAPLRILFLLFVILPIAEIVVLIQVGGAIGAMPTIGLVLLTAFIGAGLLRQQGSSALLRAREKMAQGGIPAHEMVEGLFLAVGGALLLTPGFITDAIGFSCLLPGIRNHIIRWGSKHLSGSWSFSSMHGQSFDQQKRSFSDRSNQSSSKDDEKNRVIEGEYDREK